MYIQGQRPWLPFSVLVGIRGETEGLIFVARLIILKGKYKLLLSQLPRQLTMTGIKIQG